MAAAVIFMQWQNYAGEEGGKPFFEIHPLSFNSRQERLHRLQPGDRLWLVSRCSQDGQYYFVGVLAIAAIQRNQDGSDLGSQFGEYAVVADRERSVDLGNRFPAEALLRAFTYETDRPIKYGANIGQSLQTLRFLSADDESLLDKVAGAHLTGGPSALESTCGLWTKCDAVFASYFLRNWTARREPLAFLLYDPPPALPEGAPVFIHSDKNLRLVARFLRSQFVSGHKLTVEPDERMAERERIWTRFRAQTVDPPLKTDFDEFWEGQNGVRALFTMDELTEVSDAVSFKVYGRALEWGFPMGVGYRYLTLAQCLLLLRMTGLAGDAGTTYSRSLFDALRQPTAVNA